MEKGWERRRKVEDGRRKGGREGGREGSAYLDLAQGLLLLPFLLLFLPNLVGLHVVVFFNGLDHGPEGVRGGREGGREGE